MLPHQPGAEGAFAGGQHEAAAASDAKRLRPTGVVPESSSQPPAWNPPSASTLYATGLQQKAEAVSTAPSWTVDGAAMRREHFAGADPTGAELKQRQAEARRMMLRR